MEDEGRLIGIDDEVVLYNRSQHITSILVDIIISLVVFIGLIVGAVMLSDLSLYFIIALILPVAYVIFKLWKRERYIVTNKRFINHKPMGSTRAISLEDIIEVKLENDGDKRKKGCGKVNLITTVRAGDRLIIGDKEEYGIVTINYVDSPAIFKESVMSGKISSGGILKK